MKNHRLILCKLNAHLQAWMNIGRNFIFLFFFQYVKKSLTPESANFITSIVALGHIAKLCPTEFAADIKAIVSKTIVKDLLMMDRVTSL